MLRNSIDKGRNAKDKRCIIVIVPSPFFTRLHRAQNKKIKIKKGDPFTKEACGSTHQQPRRRARAQRTMHITHGRWQTLTVEVQLLQTLLML
jgi:hypothetical protein